MEGFAMNSVYAPYNFVPFSESVLLPYTGTDQLPKHNVIGPGRATEEDSGRGDLKTGEIHITITAQTPVLVAVQQEEHAPNREKETHAYAQHNGRAYVLPGSTIRGMARENMQILGFGAVLPGDDIEDVPISGHYLHEGLPVRHQELAKSKPLPDYPRAIFGYADPEESFRSRVSFEDFEACEKGKASAQEHRPIKAVLGQPKPTWYAGYVSDGKSYTEDGFRLRGYKQYWMKKFEMDVRSGKTSVSTFLHPLPAGIVFRGVIRYKNLYADELGLLLWALRLEKGHREEEDCFQNLGMGKPYGFGRVKLDIDELWEFDVKNLYSFDGLNCGAEKFGKRKATRGRQAEHPVDTAVGGYIKTYQNYALKKLKEQADGGKEDGLEYQSLLDFPEIKDFFFLHRVQKEVPSGYMTWRQYQDIRVPLPSTSDIRAKFEEKEPQYFRADESMESMLAALQKRMNSKRL